MKKALVLGASGGMGNAIVKELSGRGIEVVAFARNKSKLDSLFGTDESIKVYPGDVLSKEDLTNAATDADIIFHAINVPYPEWSTKQPLLLRNILETAKQKEVKLALVDNIYAYGRSGGKKVTEDFPKNPHTKKGKIRLQLETMTKESGVQMFIAHFPDFYGPGTENSLLNFFFQAVIQNKRGMFVGNQKLAREYVYTPDGAKAMVELAMHEKAYGQNWNIPGSDVISGKEITQIVKEYAEYNKGVTTVSKNMVRLLGLFDRMMREYVEMYYLNEEPVVLSGEKYEREIGALPRTPYKEGIEQTLDYMKSS